VLVLRREAAVKTVHVRPLLKVVLRRLGPFTKG
jgi:hypothetical protein